MTFDIIAKVKFFSIDRLQNAWLRCLQVVLRLPDVDISNCMGKL